MNKKDVENIAYILSDASCFDEAATRLVELDSRIKDEYKMFEECKGRSLEVDEKFEDLMVERYGHNWAYKRDKLPSKDVLEEVRRDVYGEDYDLIFKT